MLSYDPAITLLDIYPRKMKICIHAKSCMQMFIAAIFIITPKWKQTQLYQRMSGYVKSGYLYSGVLFGHKHDADTCYTWINLENIMLREWSLSQKTTLFCLYKKFRIGKSMRQKLYSWLPSAGGERGIGEWCVKKGGDFLYTGIENVLKSIVVMMPDAQLCECTKN